MRLGERITVKTSTHDFEEDGTLRDIGAGEHGRLLGWRDGGRFARVSLEGSGPATVPTGALLSEEDKDKASIRRAISGSGGSR